MKLLKNNLLLIMTAVFIMFAMMVTAPEDSPFDKPEDLQPGDINADLSAEQVRIVMEQRPDLITRLDVDQIRQYGMRNLVAATLASVNTQILTQSFTANDAEVYFSGEGNTLPRQPLTTEEIILYNRMYPEVVIDDSLILQAEGLTFGDGFVSGENGRVNIPTSGSVKLAMTPEGYLTDGIIVVRSGEVTFNGDGSYYLGGGSDVRTTQGGDMVRTTVPTTLHIGSTPACTQCIALDHNSRSAFIDGNGITLQLGENNNNWALSVGASEGISYILDRAGNQALKIKNGMILLNPDRVDTGFATVTDKNGNELGFDTVTGDCALNVCNGINGKSDGITAMGIVDSEVCSQTGMIILKVWGDPVYSADVTSNKEELARLMAGFTGEVMDGDEYSEEFLQYIAANIRNLEISVRVDTTDVPSESRVRGTTVDYVDEVMDIDDIEDMPREIQRWIQFRIDNRATVKMGGRTVSTFSRTPSGESTMTITLYSPSGEVIGTDTFTGEDVVNVAIRSWFDPEVNVADDEPNLLMRRMLDK